MKHPSNIPSATDTLNLRDQIHEKINKAKSVLTCIMFAAEFVSDGIGIDRNTLYHALWALDDYLEEITDLCTC